MGFNSGFKGLNIISLLVPGDPGRLGTLISVGSVETSRRNNLAVRCGNEYQSALMYSLYAANTRHETPLLLRLVASP